MRNFLVTVALVFSIFMFAVTFITPNVTKIRTLDERTNSLAEKTACLEERAGIAEMRCVHMQNQYKSGQLVGRKCLKWESACPR